MKKVKLEIDDLKVESFATAELEKEKGTVHGQETVPYTCPPDGRSICGVNKCDPYEDPSEVEGTCYLVCGTG